jgi:hypothetical protein
MRKKPSDLKQALSPYDLIALGGFADSTIVLVENCVAEGLP